MSCGGVSCPIYSHSIDVMSPGQGDDAVEVEPVAKRPKPDDSASSTPMMLPGMVPGFPPLIMPGLMPGMVPPPGTCVHLSVCLSTCMCLCDLFLHVSCSLGAAMPMPG